MKFEDYLMEKKNQEPQNRQDLEKEVSKHQHLCFFFPTKINIFVGSNPLWCYLRFKPFFINGIVLLSFVLLCILLGFETASQVEG